MRIYIFDRCKVSTRYHSSGGLVVVARDAYHLNEQIAAYNAAQHPDPTDESQHDAHVGETDIELNDKDIGRVHVYNVDGDVSPAIYVFPNAGCC